VKDERIEFVVALSKRHYEEIGFLPKPRLEQYADAGQLWTESENGDLCGFMVWGNGWPVLRVYQVCIQYDAQRREKGMRLVRRLIDKATSEGYEAVSCYVADDIDANHFWRAAGFVCAGQRDVGNRRGRKHNNWVLRMDNPLQRVLALTEEA
jgi:L-amino acid N-acyltransferase YncA